MSSLLCRGVGDFQLSSNTEYVRDLPSVQTCLLGYFHFFRRTEESVGARDLWGLMDLHKAKAVTPTTLKHILLVHLRVHIKNDRVTE